MLKKYRNNRGATAIEYGIIAAGIAVAIMAGLTVTGTNTKQTFCTIASAIGSGSGNCSGSSSGSSYSSLVGITTKAQFDALNADLNGKIDMTYVANVFGGKDSAGTYFWNKSMNLSSEEETQDEEELKQINSTDPITNVFGVYTPDKTALTNYQDVINGLDTAKNNNFTLLNNHLGTSEMEVTTQSGKIYTINNNSATQIN